MNEIPRFLPASARTLLALLLVLVCLGPTAGRAQTTPPTPTISSFSPASGPVGTKVVIDGSDFSPPIKILFGGVPASSGSFGSTKITVVVPSGAQTGRIKITTPAGDAFSSTAFVVDRPILPVATLAATIPAVTEGSGKYGQFTVSLSAKRSSDTLVNYTVKGDAINATDYALLTGTLKIKAGHTGKVINIIPKGDLDGVAEKLVKLRLASGDGYTIGTTTAEKVTILAK